MGFLKLRLPEKPPSRSLQEKGSQAGAWEPAKSSSAQKVEPPWKHAPANIAQEALPAVCKGEKDGNYSSRLSAVRGFRRNYQNLPDHAYSFRFTALDTAGHVYFKPTPEYQALLLDIDRTLCTLSACADLRDDIVGLDCKPYLQPVPKNP